MDNKSPTVEQLRDAISSGATGDKVAFPDPAAAPLGADEEAAGEKPSVQAVAQAHRHETAPTRPKHKFAWRLATGEVVLVAAVSVGAWAAGAGLAVITA